MSSIGRETIIKRVNEPETVTTAWGIAANRRQRRQLLSHDCFVSIFFSGSPVEPAAGVAPSRDVLYHLWRARLPLEPESADWIWKLAGFCWRSASLFRVWLFSLYYTYAVFFWRDWMMNTTCTMRRISLEEDYYHLKAVLPLGYVTKVVNSTFNVKKIQSCNKVASKSVSVTKSYELVCLICL